MGAALAIIAAAQTALDRISDMRTLAGALERDADVPRSSDRPAAKAWRRKSSVRSDIVVITDKVVQGADDVVIGDPDQPNRVRPTEKS